MDEQRLFEKLDCIQMDLGTVKGDIKVFAEYKEAHKATHVHLDNEVSGVAKDAAKGRSVATGVAYVGGFITVACIVVGLMYKLLGA